MSGILVGSKCMASRIVYSSPTPNKLIATTNSPLTAPPRSAIWSALLRLERAALAVRMFERTATYMPTMPATPDHPRRARGADVRAHGHVHADDAGHTRAESAEQEGQRGREREGRGGGLVGV